MSREVLEGLRVDVLGLLDKIDAALAAANAGRPLPPSPVPPLKTLSIADYHEAAQLLSVPVAAVHAVDEVESNGKGFGPDGRPIILFEPHVFSRLTKHRYDDTHGGVSYAKRGTKPYPKSQAERWAQMEYAADLDEEAAWQSASWGRFQIMGFNFAACGFASVALFCLAMKRSERDHLMAFVSFVKFNKLDDELRALNWAGFARGYNGPGYAANAYDTKLAKAYAKWSAQ